jgi:hypothetical protein
MIMFFSPKAQENLWKEIQNSLTSEFVEEFLQALLNLMKIMFVINHEYRENIMKFNGRYQFCSEDGQVTMAAVFSDGRMRVLEKMIDHPHITITFRDGQTLLNFMISPRQDILGSMLRHDVRTKGNLNYLYKFGYMAKKLQLMMPQP